MTFGKPSNPVKFSIGNGGAGYTGILRKLAEAYLSGTSNDFRIGWISNHSRHTQIALLADVVQLALTYEPENENIAINEGWAVRLGKAFNDHFILVGPEKIDVGAHSPTSLLQAILALNFERLPEKGDRRLVLHSRGDGSATFEKEKSLFSTAEVDMSAFVETHPGTPYEALIRAEKEQAFLLTDRATFLTAIHDRAVYSLRVHVEGGEQLLNPCSVLIRSSTLWSGRPPPPADEEARRFARWLCEAGAQNIIRDYGREWEAGKPLFTVATQDEFDAADRLIMP